MSAGILAITVLCLILAAGAGRGIIRQWAGPATGRALAKPPEAEVTQPRPRENPPSAPPAVIRPKPVVPTKVFPSDQVSIVARFAVVEGQLETTYAIENRRSNDIWILGIEERTSPPHYVPRAPRVEFESPETAVLACWWEYQPPAPGTAWVTPPVFYGTRVSAGKKHSAAIRVRLPLLAAGDGHEVLCASARFEVAVILEAAMVQTVEINGRILGRFFLEALASQKVLSAPARPVRVRLRFDRPTY